MLELWEDTKGGKVKGEKMLMGRWLFYPHHLPETSVHRRRTRAGLDAKQVYEQCDKNCEQANPLASVRALQRVLCRWQHPSNRVPSDDELRAAHAWFDSAWDNKKEAVVDLAKCVDKPDSGAQPVASTAPACGADALAPGYARLRSSEVCQQPLPSKAAAAPAATAPPASALAKAPSAPRAAAPDAKRSELPQPSSVPAGERKPAAAVPLSTAAKAALPLPAGAAAPKAVERGALPKTSAAAPLAAAAAKSTVVAAVAAPAAAAVQPPLQRVSAVASPPAGRSTDATKTVAPAVMSSRPVAVPVVTVAPAPRDLASLAASAAAAPARVSTAAVARPAAMAGVKLPVPADAALLRKDSTALPASRMPAPAAAAGPLRAPPAGNLEPKRKRVDAGAPSSTAAAASSYRIPKKAKAAPDSLPADGVALAPPLMVVGSTSQVAPSLKSWEADLRKEKYRVVRVWGLPPAICPADWNELLRSTLQGLRIKSTSVSGWALPTGAWRCMGLGYALVVAADAEAAVQRLSACSLRCPGMNTLRPLFAERFVPPDVAARDEPIVGHVMLPDVPHVNVGRGGRDPIVSHFVQSNTLELDMSLQWRTLVNRQLLGRAELLAAHVRELRALLQGGAAAHAGK